MTKKTHADQAAMAFDTHDEQAIGERRIAAKKGMVAEYGRAVGRAKGVVGTPEAATLSTAGAMGAFIHNVGRTMCASIKARMHVGNTRLPMHLSAKQLQSDSSIIASNRATHHMAMQELAGANWRGDPRGFRIAPASPKNPKFHIKGSATRLEALVVRAGA